MLVMLIFIRLPSSENKSALVVGVLVCDIVGPGAPISAIMSCVVLFALRSAGLLIEATGFGYF